MSFSVHFVDAPEAEYVALLKEHLQAGIELTTGEELPDGADFDVLISGRPTLEQIQASPNLKHVIVPWAGVPPQTRTILTDFPQVSLHNLHHNDTTTAELGFALLLSAAKFVPSMDRMMRSHDWTPRYEDSPAILLHDKTALILGYGAIGRELARMCKGMGMTILATRRSPEQDRDEYADEIHPAKALAELLPRANVVLVALPHTPETEGLIGQEALALLPEPAVLVNIGRGKVVDQQALYEALRDGRLHAAGLDVWYNYPDDEADRTNTPPSDYPFHELDNVVMSPHRGGATMEIEPIRMKDLARLLNAAANGKPMPNKVNLERGY